MNLKKASGLEQVHEKHADLSVQGKSTPLMPSRRATMGVSLE
jgi:hypothetical protein